MDKNLEELQDELKVLKNELKETLVDIRDHLLTTAQNPFHSGPSLARGTKDTSPKIEDEPEETVKVSAVAPNRATGPEMQASSPTVASSPAAQTTAPAANGGGPWPAQFGGGPGFPNSPPSLFGPPLQSNAAGALALDPQSGPMPEPGEAPARMRTEKSVDKVERMKKPTKVNGYRKVAPQEKEMFLPEEDEEDEKDMDGDMDMEDEDKMSTSKHNGHNGKNGKAGTDALLETELVASAPKRKPQGQAADLVTVAMLAPWLDTSLQKIGRERLIAVVSMYSSMGGISNELKDVIVQLIQLDGADAPKSDVPLRDSLRVLAELDDLLQRGRLDVTGAALLSVYLNGKTSPNRNSKARPRNL